MDMALIMIIDCGRFINQNLSLYFIVKVESYGNKVKTSCNRGDPDRSGSAPILPRQQILKPPNRAQVPHLSG